MLLRKSNLLHLHMDPHCATPVCVPETSLSTWDYGKGNRGAFVFFLTAAIKKTRKAQPVWHSCGSTLCIHSDVGQKDLWRSPAQPSTCSWVRQPELWYLQGWRLEQAAPVLQHPPSKQFLHLFNLNNPSHSQKCCLAFENSLAPSWLWPPLVHKIRPKTTSTAPSSASLYPSWARKPQTEHCMASVMPNKGKC